MAQEQADGTDSRDDEPGCLISIVIPAFNHLDLTRQCIKSVRENTPYNLEIIVIDNASMDGTAEYLAGEAVKAITNSENLGFPKAANQGISAASGKYVCLLNNDVIVLPGWLPPLIDALEQDPLACAAGPKQVSPQGRVWHAGTAFGPESNPNLARKPFHIFIDFPEDDALVNVGREYPAMNFGCCLIPRRLFDEVGAMDDDTFLFPGLFEDVDWCIRARKKSYRCFYRPDSKVIHTANQTLYGSGESLKAKSMAAVSTNLERLLAKWADEPESFLVPKHVLPVLDSYFDSAVYLKKECEESRRQISDLRAYVHDLEEAMRQASEANREAAAYARRLESEWKSKCDELQAANGRIAQLERETGEGKKRRFRSN